MEFGSIIKRAWQVTWRHKALWVLGLFAGATGGGWGGGGGGGSGYRFGAQDYSQVSRYVDLESAYSYLQDWLPVILAAIVLLFLIAILWTVIGLAAQGGLVHQVNEAAERRQVRLGAGWTMGFHYWGRVALAGLILLLPLLVLALAVAAVTAVAFVLPLASGEMPGAGTWAAMMGLVILMIPVSIVVSFLLTNLYVLALRFIVLEDRHATDSVSAAWSMIRHRFKDVFLMWLITLGLGIAFGLVVAVPVIFFALGIGITAMIGVWPVSVLLGLVVFSIALVLGAGYNTFSSALWTIFFRQITGRESAQSAVVPAGGAPYAYPSTYGQPHAQPPTPPAPAGYAPPLGAPPVAGYAPAPAPAEVPTPPEVPSSPDAPAPDTSASPPGTS